VPPSAPPNDGYDDWRSYTDYQPRRSRDEEEPPGGLAVDADVPESPAIVPVRRLLSLGIAGFAALLTVGLVVGGSIVIPHLRRAFDMLVQLRAT